MLGEEGRRRLAGPDDRVADEPAEKGQVGDDAADLGLLERVRKAGESLPAGRPVRDQLRDQRVVRRADLVAFRDARVDPDAVWQPQPLDRPGLRQERAGILGVQPDLDRVAGERSLL